MKQKWNKAKEEIKWLQRVGLETTISPNQVGGPVSQSSNRPCQTTNIRKIVQGLRRPWPPLPLLNLERIRLNDDVRRCEGEYIRSLARDSRSSRSNCHGFWMDYHLEDLRWYDISSFVLCLLLCRIDALILHVVSIKEDDTDCAIENLPTQMSNRTCQAARCCSKNKDVTAKSVRNSPSHWETRQIQK